MRLLNKTISSLFSVTLEVHNISRLVILRTIDNNITWLCVCMRVCEKAPRFIQPPPIFYTYSGTSVSEQPCLRTIQYMNSAKPEVVFWLANFTSVYEWKPNGGRAPAAGGLIRESTPH